MAALAADRQFERQPSELVPYSGASGFTYYKGALLTRTGAATSTGVVPLTSAGSSNGYFLGVVGNRVDLSAGLGSSNELLDVWKTGEFTFAANGTGASSHIGLKAYGIDDGTVGISAVVPSLAVGEIVGIPTTSTYRVRIDEAVGGRGVSIHPNF